MRPSEVFEQNRQYIREAAPRYRAKNPRLFGSVLHGTDNDSSDIDILVDPMPGATLFDLIGLEQDLERVIGVPVQIVVADELHRFIRDRVIAEAQPI
jgi:predicted nucleotidyltransferase